MFQTLIERQAANDFFRERLENEDGSISLMNEIISGGSAGVCHVSYNIRCSHVFPPFFPSLTDLNPIQHRTIPGHSYEPHGNHEDQDANASNSAASGALDNSPGGEAVRDQRSLPGHHCLLAQRCALFHCFLPCVRELETDLCRQEYWGEFAGFAHCRWFHRRCICCRLRHTI